MDFYGFQKTTLLDYPKHIAAVLFTRGCNMQCPYCHNPELAVVSGSELHAQPVINDTEFFTFLEKRKNILEAVCITGGEPLLYGDTLISFIQKLREYGKKTPAGHLKIKLDTNGLLPDLLPKVDVDYIAMDLKTSPEKYDKLGFRGTEVRKKLTDSINWIINNTAINYEFRTTVVPGLVTKEDITHIAHLIAGASNYVLTQYRPEVTLDPSYAHVKPYDIEVLQEMKEICESYSITTTIRANYSAS